MVKYEVNEDHYRSRTEYRVTRRIRFDSNSSQGWGVATYMDREVADEVAAFLNEHLPEEV